MNEYLQIKLIAEFDIHMNDISYGGKVMIVIELGEFEFYKLHVSMFDSYLIQGAFLLIPFASYINVVVLRCYYEQDHY